MYIPVYSKHCCMNLTRKQATPWVLKLKFWSENWLYKMWAILYFHPSNHPELYGGPQLSRQNKIQSKKIKFRTTNWNYSRQTTNIHGKNKNSRHYPEFVITRANCSRQKQIAHGNSKLLTAKTNRSRTRFSRLLWVTAAENAPNYAGISRCSTYYSTVPITHQATSLNAIGSYERLILCRVNSYEN